jgi:hypothetical protein
MLGIFLAMPVTQHKLNNTTAQNINNNNNNDCTTKYSITHQILIGFADKMFAFLFYVIFFVYYLIKAITNAPVIEIEIRNERIADATIEMMDMDN